MSDIKRLLFCDFKPDIKNQFSKNSLVCNNFYNISLSNGTIDSNLNTCDLMKTFLTESQYENFTKLYGSLYANISRFIPYQYVDESGSLKLRIFAIDKNNSINEYNADESNLINFNTTLSGNPKIVYHNNSVYILDGTSTIYVVSGPQNLAFYQNTKKISYVKFYRDKTYYMLSDKPNTIYVATDIEFEKLLTSDPPNESLLIDINYGNFQDVLICDDYIYIIQDYGIAKIQKTKDETYFTYFKTHTKIITGTAKSVNNLILFYSAAGLYKFDGNKITPLFVDLFNLCNKQGIAETFNNKYYLSTQMYTNKETINCLIEINLFNDTYVIFSIGKVCLLETVELHDFYNLIITTCDDGFFNSLSMGSKFNNHTCKKYVEFNPVFLDNYDEKSIVKLNIFAEGEFRFKIISNNGDSISYNVSNSFSANNISLFGQHFKIEISSISNFKIYSIYLEYKTINHD